MQAGELWFPRAGLRSKIVDDNGESVRDGEIGNLWVRGASAFAEYCGSPN